MITREEAAALVAHVPGPWRISASTGQVSDRMGEVLFAAPGASVDHALLVQAAPDLARTVVALYDERAKVTAERDAARIVLQQLAPLDRVEWVWPDDFPDGERPDCLCSACGDAVLVETGHEWAQGRDVCHDCATMRSEALSAVTRERDALRENQRGALAAIQANAEIAEKYAAKADALALELRRLRAAETPGTDDAAFEGTGWRWDGPERTWIHDSTGFITRQVSTVRPWLVENDPSIPCPRLALDAMRAAVPGSV